MWKRLRVFFSNQVLCRPPGGGPRLDRRARIQFGAGTFWRKTMKNRGRNKQKRDLPGVTTDLLDVQIEDQPAVYFSPNSHSFLTVVKRDKYNSRYYLYMFIDVLRGSQRLILRFIHVIIDQYFDRGNREHWKRMWQFDSFARNSWCWCKLMA